MNALSKFILPFAIRAIAGIIITRMVIVLFEEPKPVKEKHKDQKKQPVAS
jgi:hypothetical protein